MFKDKEYICFPFKNVDEDYVNFTTVKMLEANLIKLPKRRPRKYHCS